MMSSQKTCPTRDPDRIIDPQFVLTVTVSTLLALSCSALAFVQQTSDSPERPEPAAQSASGPAQPAQTQTPTPPQQPQTPASPNAKQRKANCQHPANPGKSRFGCKDEDFAWDEALTADWNGARAEVKRLGITPSGSYYSALQTNVSGGSHQMWGYAGQLTTALDLNFEKLLKIPGMSLYLSSSWGTGGNLTTTLGTVFPVNVNYAVGAFVQEMYLQQKFLKGNLTVSAGRVAASYTFAGLPVFDNYVSLAINPSIWSVVSNDVSYSGPAPGLEWGAQAVYNITPVVQVAAGAFNTNPNSASNGNIMAFQQGNKGALVTTQAIFTIRGPMTRENRANIQLDFS